MKNKNLFVKSGVIAFVLAGFGALNASAAPANSAFTSEDFYRCVVDSYNRRTGSEVGFDTSLTDEQLARIDVLTCAEQGFSDVRGIEKLTGMRDAYLHENELVSIDLSQNTALKWAFLGRNKLTSARFGAGVTLLDLRYNQLTSFDLSLYPALVELNLRGNPLTTLNTATSSDLNELDVSETQIKNLDVKGYAGLVLLKVPDGTMIDADITTTKTDDIYQVDISRIVSDNTESVINLDDPGFIFRSTITNTDQYTYDSSTSIITITNPESVNGFIKVGGYNLLVPIGEIPVEEEEIVVPNTSAGGMLAPDTGGGLQEMTSRAVSVTGMALAVLATTTALTCYIGQRVRGRIGFDKH